MSTTPAIQTAITITATDVPAFKVMSPKGDLLAISKDAGTKDAGRVHVGGSMMRF